MIIVDGFLQTKEVSITDNRGNVNKSRISSIVCQWIWFIDSSFSKGFDEMPLDIKRPIYGEIKKLDFNKPKEPVEEL